jgi:hypothetical protein
MQEVYGQGEIKNQFTSGNEKKDWNDSMDTRASQRLEQVYG